MEGIDAIKKDEEHRKRLKRLTISKFLRTRNTVVDPSVYKDTAEEKDNYVQQLQENFMKNGKIPQIIDIEYL